MMATMMATIIATILPQKPCSLAIKCKNFKVVAHLKVGMLVRFHHRNMDTYIQDSTNQGHAVGFRSSETIELDSQFHPLPTQGG